MNFDVPQYIDVEDKIAFQLTAKQLGWFGLGGVLMFFAWEIASHGYFIMWSVIIVLACLGMAFVKPYGITLASFIGYGFLFLVKPKQFIWQRNIGGGLTDMMNADENKQEKNIQNKTLDNVDRLANVLDTRRIK